MSNKNWQHSLYVTLILSFASPAGASLCPSTAVPSISSTWQEAQPLKHKGSCRRFLEKMKRDIAKWTMPYWLSTSLQVDFLPQGVPNFRAVDVNKQFQQIYNHDLLGMAGALFYAEVGVGHLLLAQEYVRSGLIKNADQALEIVLESYDQLEKNTQFVVTFHQRPQNYRGLINKMLPDAEVSTSFAMKKVVGVGRAVKRTSDSPTPTEIDTGLNLFDGSQFQGKTIIELSRGGLFEHDEETRTIHHQKMIEAALNMVTPGNESNTLIVASIHNPRLKELWSKRFGFQPVDGFQNIPLNPMRFGAGVTDLIAIDAATLKAYWLASAQELLRSSLGEGYNGKAFALTFFSGLNSGAKQIFSHYKRELIEFKHRQTSLKVFTNSEDGQGVTAEITGPNQYSTSGLKGSFQILKRAFLLDEHDHNSGVDVIQVEMQGKDKFGRNIKIKYSLPVFSGTLRIVRTYTRKGEGINARQENTFQYFLEPSSGAGAPSYSFVQDEKTEGFEGLTETMSIPLVEAPLFVASLDPLLKKWQSRFRIMFPSSAQIGESIQIDDPQIVPSAYTWDLQHTNFMQNSHARQNGINFRDDAYNFNSLSHSLNLSGISNLPLVASLYTHSRNILRESIPLNLFWKALGFQEIP